VERRGAYTVVVGILDVKRVFGRLCMRGRITRWAMYL
jgi:hypothetical protein